MLHYCIKSKISQIFQSNTFTQRVKLFSQTSQPSLHIPPIQNLQHIIQVQTKQLLIQLKQRNIPRNVAILHALAHIQFNAFMSYADSFLRFDLDPDFRREMKATALEQASHHILLCNRLKELSFAYGDLSVVGHLTRDIQNSQHSVLERLAVVSLAHQGKGIRAIKRLIAQLGTDKASINILQLIQSQEAGHYEVGKKWFIHYASKFGLNYQQEIDKINIKYKCKISLQ